MSEQTVLETKTYGEWIKSVMADKGLTVLVCCRRAKDENGKPMEHSQWNALMEDEPKRADGGAPKRGPKVAKRVALGLDVSEKESIDAAARAAGYLHDSRPESLRGVPGTIILIPAADPTAPATKGDIDELKRYFYEMVKQARWDQKQSGKSE